MINDASILITGGTGSFGRKFVEMVASEYRPKKLIVFSRDELKQHEMRQQYSELSPGSPVRYFIGDVRDLDRLKRAMKGVDIVVHTAALKQVPACEYNPFEAVQTNIIGAKNVIDAAIDCGVKRVLALSTDKAVNPVNLYGATKLCAEKLFVQGNAYAGLGGTRFACARYGNVVGSRGSVIPLFLQQRATGVITVTDKRMTRFWIRLEDGVRFVLRCLERMHGGEVFVPKIPSMSLMDLAEVIAPECEIRFTGMRPGEKMHELLISPDEARTTLEFPDYYVVQPSHPWWKTENCQEGKPLAEGFVYSSNANPLKLSVEALREMVAEHDKAASQATGETVTV